MSPLSGKSRSPASNSTNVGNVPQSSQQSEASHSQAGVPISFSGSLPQSAVFGDFALDESGFGRWTALNSKLGARLLCRNGTVEAIRQCNDPGNPSACIGAVERIASCAEFGIEKEKFSAWGAWKPVSACVSGMRDYVRSCFALDGQTPVCYGPASARLSCNFQNSETFTRMGECGPPPAGYAFDQYYTGCGGFRFYYNGQRITQSGCRVDENGGIDCSQAVSSTEFCVRPGTTCGGSVAQNPAGYIPGTIYQTPVGTSCGIPLSSITTPENKISAPEIVRHHEIAGYTLECGARNHVVKAKTCKRNTNISECQLDIMDIVAGKQNDASCDEFVSRQIESCSYSSVSSSYLNNLRRNGEWSAWEQTSGCAFIPSLNKVARLETRTCGQIGNGNTELDGVFCEGERTRFVECSGVLAGNSLLVLHSSSLGSSILEKLNAYANVVRGKGADVEVVSRDSALSVAELRSFLASHVLPSGAKPNSVLLVGGFPHAQVKGQNASNQVGNIFSDLPFETPLSHYSAQADGTYVLAADRINQPVVLERAVFWLDFSNHSALVAPYTSVLSKYSAIIDRIIQRQLGSVSVITLNQRAKMNMLVDGFWDSQAYHISHNKADIEAYIGTSRSGRGGLMELMAKPGDLAVVMAHSNGSIINLGGKSYLPSNDSLDPTISSVGQESFLSGVPVMASHLNLYSCHSGDPSVSNNVMNSALLNPQGKVVSMVASTTSGALDNWTGYRYYDKLALGHSAAASFRHFMNANVYGQVQVMGPYRYESIQSLGPTWFTGLILSGDPLFQAGRETQANGGNE